MLPPQEGIMGPTFQHLSPHAAASPQQSFYVPQQSFYVPQQSFYVPQQGMYSVPSVPHPFSPSNSNQMQVYNQAVKINGQHTSSRPANSAAIPTHSSSAPVKESPARSKPPQRNVKYEVYNSGWI
jgi:hypothetical protein